VSEGPLPISQNARFHGNAPPDEEFDHPAGASMARMLLKGLQGAGWSVAGFDNWRDCGWSLDCARGESRLRIAFSQIEDGQWMLQVAPSRVPGWVGRWFGASVSAQPSQTTELANLIHAILEAEGDFHGFLWTWDGFPEKENSHPRPQPWISGRQRS
jgi:hypothetical protein